MDKELKPCPICGGEAEFRTTISDTHGFCTCKYKRCVEQHFTKNINDAISEWNTRMPINKIIDKLDIMQNEYITFLTKNIDKALLDKDAYEKQREIQKLSQAIYKIVCMIERGEFYES